MSFKPPTEQDIVRACLDYLRLVGVPAWRQNQGAVKTAAGGFVRFCGATGVSDILGVCPPSGRLLAVEVKRPGKEPLAHQQQFLDSVARAGGVTGCVHDIDELRALLELEGVLPCR